jgi:hypothetical protein
MVRAVIIALICMSNTKISPNILADIYNDNIIKLLVLHDGGDDTDRYFSRAGVMEEYVKLLVKDGGDISDFSFEYHIFDTGISDWLLVEDNIYFTCEVEVRVKT